MSGEHFDLELQDLLDGRLSPDEQTRVRAHVRSCDHCRDELDALGRSRDLVRNLAPHAPPADLERDVKAALAASVPSDRHQFLVGRRRFVIVAGGAAAAAVVAALYLRRTADWPQDAIDAYREYQAGRRSLESQTSDPAALEVFFGARLPFHTRVFDLAMMNYRLLGGRTDRIGGRSAAMYVYAGRDQRHLLCEMFTGSMTGLPAPSERRERNGLNFFIYSRPPYTAVFWQEGEIVCVLVSDMSAEETIALAFAKATKA